MPEEVKEAQVQQATQGNPQGEVQEKVQEPTQSNPQEKTEAQLIVKERCDKLFELLSKKDLSDEERASAKTMVQEAPELLMQKDFVAHFSLPNLASDYQKGDDMAPLLEQNSKAITEMKQVLDNLKDIEVTKIEGKPKRGYNLKKLISAIEKFLV